MPVFPVRWSMERQPGGELLNEVYEHLDYSISAFGGL
jgi:hypothetical protein